MKKLLAALVGLLLFVVVACADSGAKNGASGGAANGSGGTGAGASAAGGSGATGAVSEPGVLFIQEGELGFSAVDGKVLPKDGPTNITGYTGTGFSDGDSGFGTSISYSLHAESSGTRALSVRYAFGGTETNLRDAALLVNGVTVIPSVEFPYTGAWTTWQETAEFEVELSAGPNFIELTALHESGLANIDYLKVVGEGVRGSEPNFTVTLGQNDERGGTVSISPEADFYPLGTKVTLTAVANDGYFFQSFAGDVSSAKSEFTFIVDRRTTVTALFLPNGTEQDPALVGFAAIQDDEGTPFLLHGGSLGEEVTATSYEELKAYLESPEPYVVNFSGKFEGADLINVASNKTLRGQGDSAHLQGIELKIDGSRNVIVQNVAISHVVADGAGPANDAIEITGGARNVWIDHCELFSDLDHGKDYYDGLLDIKNEASFVTVSWTVFHHHFKVSLISSSDQQVADVAIRATYHHNYFHDTNSRLPSVRFGKVHLFNNYYLDNVGGSAVNSRMRAVVKVENNHFENTSDPIGFSDSSATGYWDVAGNAFVDCSGSQPTTSTMTFKLPYAYTLDATADVPASVAAGAGVGKL